MHGGLRLCGHMLCCCLLAWWGQAAAGQDHVSQRAYLADPAGTLSIEEAARAPFTVLPGMLSRGYTDEVTWMRVVISPSSEPLLVLTVLPTYLDDLRLYSPRPDGSGWDMRQSGDRFAFRARERRELPFTFNVRPDPLRATVLYLRLKSVSFSGLYVVAETESDLNDTEAVVQLGIGAYLGLVLTLAGWAAMRWVSSRELIWLVYLAYLLNSLGFAVSGTGFLAKYLWPDQPAWSDAAYSINILLYVLFSLMFDWAIFRAYGGAKWFRSLLLACMGVSLLLLVAYLAGAGINVLRINVIMAAAVSLINTVMIWTLQIPDTALRRLARWSYMMLGLYGLVYIAPLLGLLPLTRLSVYPALLHNITASVMLYMVLVRRDRVAYEANLKMAEEFQHARHRIEWEQRRRDESSTFLAMLSSDLKLPLASIRHAVQALREPGPAAEAQQRLRVNNIETAIDDVAAVLERCGQVDQLEQGQWRIELALQDVAQLLSRWLAAHPQRDRIEARLPKNLIAQVDAALLQTIVSNLLDNALAYSPPHSPVQLSLTLAAARAEQTRASGFSLTVRNQVGAPGWPDPSQLFAKYYRAEATQGHAGSGVGLFLVKSVAALVGGHVRYHAREDHREIEFEVWLPR